MDTKNVVKSIKLDAVQEFVNFIKKFGVIGLAIGIVVGQAVQTLVTSLVENLLTPFVGLIPKLDDLKNLKFEVLNATFTYGQFLTDLINFIALMAVVFFAIKFAISKIMTEEELKKL